MKISRTCQAGSRARTRLGVWEGACPESLQTRCPPDAPLLALPAVLVVLARVGGARLRPCRLRGLGARARAAARGLARRIALVFTEPLNGRLRGATAAARRRRGGGAGRPARPSGGGSWSPRRGAGHAAPTGSTGTRSPTEDGHALEGAFSFGVRADAGAAPALETGPLARAGWVRILARIALYATVLVLAAVLLLPLLFAPPRGWPVPDSTPATTAAGWTCEVRAASGACAATGVGGGGGRGRGDGRRRGRRGARVGPRPDGRLPGRQRRRARARAGGGRADHRRAAARPRPRAAAGAVGARARRRRRLGHAGSADPRVPSILNDWLHLVSGALWLGGIGLLVLLWWRRVRFTRRGFARGDRARGARAVRTRRDRRVPGRGGDRARLASCTQLGRVAALWDTAYGRLLAVRSCSSALIAAASFLHARRLRPRLLDGDAPEASSAGHWTLWRSETVARARRGRRVAGLVAFPPPPASSTRPGRRRPPSAIRVLSLVPRRTSWGSRTRRARTWSRLDPALTTR